MAEKYDPAAVEPGGPLGALVDIFQIREYFNAALRLRDAADAGIRTDARFLAAVARALTFRPARQRRISDPFPSRRHPNVAYNRRIAVVATGGSGAMASLLGALRAFEELGLLPSVISMASGAALFGLPFAAGKSASEVAQFTLSLEPSDYVDVDWRGVAWSVARAGRGFGGCLAGEKLEGAYRRFLGDATLGDLVVPAYIPVWQVEENRLAYLGPRTRPALPVARTVLMAVALPLLFDPVTFEGGNWCDGGVVDILPVTPILELEPPSEAALVVNCFYPPGFTGGEGRGWREHPLAIMDLAAQVRTAQHLELARENLERLRKSLPTVEIQPVSYTKVRGVGLYTQFLDNSEWVAFMRAGRTQALAALRQLLNATASGQAERRPHGAAAA